MKNIEPILTHALQENNLVIKENAKAKLLRYLELIQTWNKVFNLTAITNPKEMVYLHLVDSLVAAPFLQGERMLDIGTGAGLPGIPLAIINPEQHWTLLDKNSKKTRFLTQVIAELKLTNATAAHTRGEDFQPVHCFDSIISRAFGSINLFVSTTQHVLCENGRLFAMKGKYPEDELKDVPNNFGVEDIIRLEVKGIDIERHIVKLKRAN